MTETSLTDFMKFKYAISLYRKLPRVERRIYDGEAFLANNASNYGQGLVLNEVAKMMGLDAHAHYEVRWE